MRNALTRGALFVALSAVIAQAQATKKAAGQSAAAQLTRLEDSWATGLVKRDVALFNKLLAPRFIYTENDQLTRRDDVLKSVTSGDTVTAAHNEGMEVHEFGATTAVVTGWLIVQGHGTSGAFTHRYRFTDTWVKGSAGWQIVAAQDYLVPK